MRERVMDAGLAALAVLAVVLVVLAFSRQAGDGTATGRESGATGSAAPSRDATPDGGTTEPTTGADADDDPAGAPTARVVDFRDGLLVQAPVWSCDSPRSTVVTVRDGADQRRAPIEGLHVVTAVQVVDGSHARVVGADEDCQTAGFTTRDAGESWERDPGARAFWGMRPGDTARVGHGDTVVDVPCEAVGVSGIDPGVARLLCADGRILGTSSAGVEWVPLGDLADAVGIAFVSPAHGYGIAESAECRGVRLRETNDGGASWQDLRCVEGPGPWAVSAWDTALAVAGDGLRVLSTDGGESWELA